VIANKMAPLHCEMPGSMQTHILSWTHTRVCN